MSKFHRCTKLWQQPTRHAAIGDRIEGSYPRASPITCRSGLSDIADIMPGLSAAVRCPLLGRAIRPLSDGEGSQASLGLRIDERHHQKIWLRSGADCVGIW